MRGPGVRALGTLGPLLGTGRRRWCRAARRRLGGLWRAPKVGAGLKSLFTRAAGALGGAAATQQLQQQYGIDLERDVFGWIGDTAMFVRGSDKASLDGGL